MYDAYTDLDRLCSCEHNVPKLIHHLANYPADSE